VDILAEVRNALADASDIPVESLREDVPLESLGLTSIHVMTAYVLLERALDISFVGGDLNYAPSNTIGGVADAIESVYARR
jgi:acyl carrier protein